MSSRRKRKNASNEKKIEFDTLIDLENFIEDYQEKHYVQLWKRDARNIETMRKFCPHKLNNCNTDLKYYSVVYSCWKGGRKFETKSLGMRQKNTSKHNCPMRMRVRLTPDGQKLQITNLNENHNHKIDKEEFLSLPKQKKECIEEPETTTVYKSDCSVKIELPVCEAYEMEKIIKQMQNISQLKSNKNCSAKDLQKAIDVIGANYSNIQIALNADNTLLGIYFQTTFMKKCFNEYPEILLLDSTYKLCNTDMSVHTMMTINGNNLGDPIATFIVTEDHVDVIRYMINIFKNNNLAWPLVQYVFTDKDFYGKQAVCAEFPTASHPLCAFHVMKRLRSDITPTSMGITVIQRTKCMQLLQKLTYAKTIVEYVNYYDQFVKLNLTNVTEYYNTNWHSIREDWVGCYRNKNTIFGVGTINHLEIFDQRIRPLCDKYTDLENFFKSYCGILESITLKRREMADTMVPKKAIHTKTATVKENYVHLLTPFAFKIVNRHLKLYLNYSVTECEGYYNVVSKKPPIEEYNIECGSYNCSCPFIIANCLPCPHVFAAKYFSKANMYDETLVHNRHLKTKFIQLFQSLDSNFVTNVQKDELTIEKKYLIAMTKCRKLAKFASKCNNIEFFKCCAELDSKLKKWNEGNNASTSEDNSKKEKIICESNIKVDKEEATTNIEGIFIKQEAIDGESDDTNMSENSMSYEERHGGDTSKKVADKSITNTNERYLHITIEVEPSSSIIDDDWNNGDIQQIKKEKVEQEDSSRESDNKSPEEIKVEPSTISNTFTHKRVSPMKIKLPTKRNRRDSDDF